MKAIHTAVESKRKLEKNLEAMLQRFHERFGLHVRAIEIDTIEVTAADDGYRRYKYSVRVRVDLDAD